MRRSLIIFLFTILQILSHANIIQVNGLIIRGTVSDLNGSPLPGASVTIEDSITGTSTDREGNYVLPSLRQGVYTIRFSFVGYETDVRKLNLNSDTVLNITLAARSYITEEVLVSATRAGRNSPLAYTTVSREEIAKNNTAQDIPYVLGFTPSLVVSSDAGTGVGYTTLNIRGSDVKRINVTIDGIPVNDAESHGVWWVDLPDLASSADNIQIQRGVGTSTNGAGAFGATINFQTSDLRKEPYAEFNSSYGSFNTSKNTLNIGTGLINNKYAVDARLSKIWSDGYIDRAYSDLKSFYVSGTRYGEKSMLKLVIFSGIEHTYQAWYGVPKDSLKSNRTYNPYSYDNETDNYWQDNYQLHYSNQISSILSANFALHYTRGKGYYENYSGDTGFSSFNLPDAVFGSDTISTSDFVAQKWLKNDFYGFTYSLKLTKDKLNAVLGGGWNRYKGDHFGEIVWAKIVTFNGESYRWYDGTGDKKDLNTFLKVNYSFTDKLNLYADIQFRKIDYSIGGIDEELEDVTQNHKYNFFNPKGGFTYRFDNRHKVYASFGISQREPDRGNFTDADPGETPLPEKLFDYEAAYEYKSSGFMLRGNLFYMNYINQLILTGEINSTGSTIHTNVPKSYRQGIELETAIQLFQNLNWNGNLTLSRNIIPEFVDYTDNWDDYSQDQQVLKDKEISFSPSVVAASLFDFVPVDNLHLLFNTKYVGKQYIDNTGNNERMLDRYLLQNVSILYTVRNKIFNDINFQLAVNNLFNEKYETNAWVYKYTAAGSLNIMDGYFPQAGINFMFKVGIKF